MQIFSGILIIILSVIGMIYASEEMDNRFIIFLISGLLGLMFGLCLILTSFTN